MLILNIVIALFLVLEVLNIIILYFFPGTKKGNGIGVFRAYEKAKKDPEISALISYLVYWIAGTKLIFVTLLIVILFTGSDTTKQYAVIALIASISSFFWKLFPSIRKIDNENGLIPKGYSKTLGTIIFCFVLMFAISLFIK